MPYKICKNCKKQNGVRTLTCECGYSFTTAKRKKRKKRSDKGKTRVTRKKRLAVIAEGQKRESGAVSIPTKRRKRVKRRKTWYDSFNWKELVPGDVVQIKKGTGPYCLVKTDPLEPMKMVYMGEGNQTVTVSIVTSEGFGCHPINEKGGGGFRFVLMVDKGFNKETGIYREPHEIRVRLRPKEKDSD